jgi:hypothetical protein
MHCVVIFVKDEGNNLIYMVVALHLFLVVILWNFSEFMKLFILVMSCLKYANMLQMMTRLL